MNWLGIPTPTVGNWIAISVIGLCILGSVVCLCVIGWMDWKHNKEMREMENEKEEEKKSSNMIPFIVSVDAELEQFPQERVELVWADDVRAARNKAVIERGNLRVVRVAPLCGDDTKKESA